MFKIIFFALIGFATGQICPPPEVLHPCECEDSPPGAASEIWCMDINKSFNLKAIFDNASDFVNDGAVFDYLTIINTSLSSIEEGSIKHLKFEIVDISDNPNLTYISPRAFNATRNVTKSMFIVNNAIQNDAPYERDIFDFVNGFKNLEELSLTRNRLSSIPDDAIQNLTSIDAIRLYRNRITKVGSRAFAGLPSLTLLWLDASYISSEGILPDTFDGIINNTVVHLECNMIDHLPQDRFQPLLEQAASVGVGPSEYFCWDADFKFQTLHCDGRADWICDNKEKYEGKLIGFNCEIGTGHTDIWEYCEGRHSKI